ncbi:alpha-1,3-mannosyl-glycoprotein 2-beta-N-acetylglucosaminyltransferase-like isoform X2 [Oscarella lobularis]|uniref:alpha-1,3-mannosyl-glycoprotein 2-beta-N-acetylglucosaminyltransferase-like isoform X2 n=1 Tax=Oscarella lobularis TaxID=121494 RepID=UPI003314167D
MSRRRLLLVFVLLVLAFNAVLFYSFYIVNPKTLDEVFIHTHYDADRLSQRREEDTGTKTEDKDPTERVEKQKAIPSTPAAKVKTPKAKKEPNQPIDTSRTEILPILVLACNRPTVSRCLDLLLRYRAQSTASHPIIVSQDCGHEPTAQAIRSYGDQIRHIEQPDLSSIPMQGGSPAMQGYYKISRHYKWALTQIFDVMKYDSVIIVEGTLLVTYALRALGDVFGLGSLDDLDVSPDFFEYFLATRKLLEEDSTLWCVSAWNDNGKENLIDLNKPELIYRSDFFPGLGWMMRLSLWNEIKDKWPKAFWDDWMRESEQRKGRACLRPEISRTRTFGKEGVSKGQFYDNHLRYIVLSDKNVHFLKQDLTYLLKSNYDKGFVSRVYRIPTRSLSSIDSQRGCGDAKEARVEYLTAGQFVSYARQFGIMNDLKDQVPRLAYKGIVSFMYGGCRVHLAPPANWKGYENSRK